MDVALVSRPVIGGTKNSDLPEESRKPKSYRGFACGTALLAIVAAACGSSPSSSPTSTTDQASSATAVTLVHDIPPDHPRIPYFDDFAAAVQTSSGGELAIEINPNGEVLAGRASLDAVRDGSANLALVNMAHVEAMEPAAGFMNLPFALDDTMMADAQNRATVYEVQAGLVRPHGVDLLGYMRGADQLFAFPRDDVNRVEDIEDRRIRVAGGGIYEQFMQQLGAQPVVIPIPEIKERMGRGEVDGVFTSPGGWTTQVFGSAPHAVQVPGLMYITYALVGNKDWLHSLPTDQREAITVAGANLTEQWMQMAGDDKSVISAAVAEGGTYRVLPDQEVARWKERVIGISEDFYRAHPSLSDELRQKGLLTEQ
jgi:TRAP-type C4-dicarboxylate transport system substrate-binding protein